MIELTTLVDYSGHRSKTKPFRDLVARPEEAWASLASYCGLDPNNVKPLEAHKK